MMPQDYRILFLGQERPEADTLWDLLTLRVQELGIDPNEWLHRWDRTDYHNAQTAGEMPLPLVTIYLGSPNPADLSEVQDIIRRGLPVFPIATSDDPSVFHKELPEECWNFQCTFQNKADWQDQLIQAILETLALIRERRRIFISYKRDNASGVAHQLFDALNGRGFQVFLDTAQVAPGRNFQNVLMHHLVDSDLLILLDTQGIGASEWVEKELLQAEDHGIAVLRLVWPDGGCHLSWKMFQEILQLKKDDFSQVLCPPGMNDRLENSTMAIILSRVEAMRAKAVGRHLKSLQLYCHDMAAGVGLKTAHHPGGLLLIRDERPTAWLSLLMGVPVSQDFHAFQKDQPSRKLPSCLTSLYYKSEGMDPVQKRHIQWLQQELTISLLDQVTLADWLGEIP